MVKTRMILKNCPECSEQTAVASKKCTRCGHKFTMKVESVYSVPHKLKSKRSKKTATKTSPNRAASSSGSANDQRRRTSRVSRGKPQYYDAVQFEKKKKKSKKAGSSKSVFYTKSKTATTEPVIAGNNK